MSKFRHFVAKSWKDKKEWFTIQILSIEDSSLWLVVAWLVVGW